MPRSPVMIGREAELALLLRVLADARSGDAQTAVIRGEAGIGKTRLVRELGQALPDDVLVASAHALPSGGAFPFGVVADLLRSVVREAGIEQAREILGARVAALAPLAPGLGDGAQAPVDRFAVAVATPDLLRGVTAGGQGALLLVVEDVHWSDRSSLDLLTIWARSQMRSPILLLLTVRPTIEDNAVAERLALIERSPTAQAIELGPLSASHVTQQALQLDPGLSPDRLREVQDLADGNPLFVEQLLATRGTTLSRSAALDLSSGLHSLPSETVEVLDFLALEARPVEVDALTAVSGAPPGQVLTALDRGYARGVLARVGATTWQFHHELLRRAAVDIQSPSIQVAGHRAWAAWLDDLPAPRLGDLVSAAEHWLQSGDRARAFAAYLRAAETASRVAPSAEADSLWRSAHSLIHEDLSVATRTEHREVYGRIAMIPTDWTEYHDLIQTERKASATHEPMIAWNLRLAGYTLDRSSGKKNVGFTREELIRAREQFVREPPDGLVYANLLDLFRTVKWLGFTDQLDPTIAALAEVEPQLPREVTAGMNLVLLARLDSSLDGADHAEERWGAIEQAVREAENRDWFSQAWVRGRYANEILHRGRLHEGLEQAREVMALVPGGPMEVAWGFGADPAVDALWLLGEWDQALELAHRHVSAYLPVYYEFLADYHRGEPYVRADNSEDGEVERMRRLSHSLAEAHVAAGTDDLRTSDLLREALDHLGEPGLRRGDAMLVMAEIVAKMTAPDESVEDALLEPAHRWLDYGPVTSAWQLQLEATVARRRGEDDADVWQQATSAWGDIGAPFNAASCRVPWAEHLAATGDAKGAKVQLTRAVQAFDAVRATARATEARRAASRARITLDGDLRSERPHRGGLTEREYDVLQVLVTGATNQQIGAELFMSPRTASVHVSHILDKLGAANRTQVATIAHQRGILTD